MPAPTGQTVRAQPISTGGPDHDAGADEALRRLAGLALDLFVVASFPALRFESVSDQGRLLLGVDPYADVRRCSWRDFATAEFVSALHETIGPGALAGRDWIGETTFQTVSGPSHPVLAFVTGMRAAAGHPDRIALAAIDMSGAGEMSASLHTEKMLLRALLTHVPDQVYFKDLNSRFLRVSDAFATKTGAESPDEFVGKTDFDLFTEEHARPAFEDEQRIIATGEAMVGKVERETWSDGRVTWVDTCKLPLRDLRGRIIGTFGISRDITERKKAEEKLQATQKELLEASRLAGMAEIASGVLHNMGNALTSAKTSVALLCDQVDGSRLPSLSRAANLLQEHTGDIAAFMSDDPRGRQLPDYLIQLADVLHREREQMMKELDQLRLNLEHMSHIVAMQQRYASGTSLAEQCQAADLVEESLHISAISLNRHGITVVRHYEPAPDVYVARHKVLQILVNLIRNAKYAMDETGKLDKPMTIAVEEAGERVRIVVRDQGVGIPRENLTKIFQFGFTTRKDGHGFGLHSSANAARDLNGRLSAHSDGPDTGATFTLELPVAEARTVPAVQVHQAL
jgi:PAS domain S-box-containing protein